MQIIPLTTAGSQILSTLVAEQYCTIVVYQKYTGLYFDLYLGNNLIIGGVICRDRTKLVRDAYLGFVGDFTFIDIIGTEDPSSDDDALGTRFLLAYLSTTDLAGQG